ncbi:MAG: choice-of-anchor A family protein [Rubrivivax sp.]
MPRTTSPALSLPAVVRLLPLCAWLAATTANAAPVVDLGPANGYSAFIFGNVAAINDVEGRMAVGGNLQGNGFSLGYRLPSGSTGPALVVAGNAQLGNGRIYGTAPVGVADTTAGAGPNPSWDPGLQHYGNGYGLVGGSTAGSASYLDLRQGSAGIDFNAARQQLTSLSQQLASATPTGQAQRPWWDIHLQGSGAAVDVFTLTLDGAAGGSSSLPSLLLDGVDPDAWAVINILDDGVVNLTAGYDNLKTLQERQGRVLFNLPNASAVNVGFVWGSILAPNAEFRGHGHVEGTVIGASIRDAFEIGWEPPVPNTPPAGVPTPGSLALAGLGLGVLAWAQRRRRQPG